MLPNFKAVVQTQVELDILTVKKWDACIKNPLSQIWSHIIIVKHHGLAIPFS